MTAWSPVLYVAWRDPRSSLTLADELTTLLDRNPELLIRVERVNPPPAPRHHRLLLTLDARAPGYPGLRGGRYEPLVADATPLPPVVAA